MKDYYLAVVKKSEILDVNDIDAISIDDHFITTKYILNDKLLLSNDLSEYIASGNDKKIKELCPNCEIIYNWDGKILSVFNFEKNYF